jgi:hypothetical protein
MHASTKKADATPNILSVVDNALYVALQEICSLMTAICSIIRRQASQVRNRASGQLTPTKLHMRSGGRVRIS